MACIRKTTVFCVLFLVLYVVFSYVEANECSSHFDCSGLQYCCDRKYPEDNVCRYSCIGQSCILDNDCAPGESCCDSDEKCATTCVGKSCTFDGDCATGECCDSADGKCNTGDCDVIKGLAGWIVAVIVISVIIVIVIPIAVVVFCCFCAAGAAAASRRPAHGGVVVTQPTTTGNTVFATQQQQQQQQYPAQEGQPMYFQNPQANPNQPPPEYQPQGTVYPPGASGGYIAMTPQTEIKP
ncbi:Hypothetical predicted protein [Paramuricea clavata]|uniref:Uncharacterized protein n=1 Tax=Paramuricea clavata TaxID=317549 RepID=A0A7D9LCZ3_PARCT|nr:Hypothetical predicted protein [Paramuricea clavata]